MPYFRWTKSKETELIEYHKEGLRYWEIAEKFGVSVNAIKAKTSELRQRGLIERRK